jgi:hypothetical protein
MGAYYLVKKTVTILLSAGFTKMSKAQMGIQFRRFSEPERRTNRV